jgi:hypothetical protein
VHHPDARAVELELRLLRQQAPYPLAVDVAVDRVQRRAHRTQELENRDVTEVAGMQDRVGLAALLEASFR